MEICCWEKKNCATVSWEAQWKRRRHHRQCTMMANGRVWDEDMRSSLWTFLELPRIQGVLFCSHLSYFTWELEFFFTFTSELLSWHQSDCFPAFKWFKVFIHVESSKWRGWLAGERWMTFSSVERKCFSASFRLEDSLHMLIGLRLIWKSERGRQQLSMSWERWWCFYESHRHHGRYWKQFIISLWGLATSSTLETHPFRVLSIIKGFFLDFFCRRCFALFCCYVSNSHSPLSLSCRVSMNIPFSHFSWSACVCVSDHMRVLLTFCVRLLYHCKCPEQREMANSKRWVKKKRKEWKFCEKSTQTELSGEGERVSELGNKDFPTFIAFVFLCSTHMKEPK